MDGMGKGLWSAKRKYTNFFKWWLTSRERRMDPFSWKSEVEFISSLFEKVWQPKLGFEIEACDTSISSVFAYPN